MTYRTVPEAEFRERIRAALANVQAKAVTGPGRSGAVASVYASHILGVPFIPYRQPVPDKLRPVLVIDTAAWTGATIRKAQPVRAGCDHADSLQRAADGAVLVRGEGEMRLTHAERQRRFRKNNPEANRAIKKRYLDAGGKAVSRARHLRERYGLTIEEFDRLIESQDGRCAICDLPFEDKMPLRPVVDHHHPTGRFRGILHRQCNAALGVFKESATLLRQAADYVDEEDTCQ